METVTKKGRPSWLENSFLETALRSGEGDPSLKVISCEVRRATAAGDNFLSEMYRITVKTVRGGRTEQRSLIVKTAPLREHMLKIVTDGNLFDLEVRALRDTIPAINRLLEEVSPGKYQPFAAKYLYSSNGPPCVIVMEDLKELGFKMPEETLGLDFDQSLLVVRTLARYHATSVVLNEKDPDLLKPFMYQDSQAIFQDNLDGMFNSSLRELAKEIKNWPEHNERFGNKIKELSEAGMKNWFSGRKRRDEEFNCLTHSDLWLNNLMFRYSDGTRNCEDIRFVDFQTGYWTSPAVDLLYFLNTSTSIDITDKHQVLIEEYHKTLGETLSLFGFQSLFPTIEQLNSQLDRSAIVGVLCVLTHRAFILADPNNLPEIDKVLKDEAKIDLSDLYKETVKKLLPVMEQRGWL